MKTLSRIYEEKKLEIKEAASDVVKEKLKDGQYNFKSKHFNLIKVTFDHI